MPIALFAPACKAKPLKPNSVSGSPKAVLQALKTTKSRGLPIRPFLRIEKLSNVIGVVPENYLDAFGPPGLNSACVAI